MNASTYVWQALPCHTTLPDFAGWLSLQIRLWFRYRASAVPKNIILVYFGGIAFLQGMRSIFYVAWVKYLNLVWFWHKGSGMEPICNYLLQGRSTISVLDLTNLGADGPTIRNSAPPSMINSLQQYLSSWHYYDATERLLHSNVLYKQRLNT